MPETAENVATDYNISRADQDLFAVASQNKAAAAQQNGTLAQEITPVVIPQKKGDPITRGAGRTSARHQPGGAGAS